MTRIATALLLTAVTAGAYALSERADIELSQQFSLETAYRFSGSFDTNRTLFSLAAKKTWERPSTELSAAVWAWKNFSADAFGLTQSDVSLRQLRASFRPGEWDVSVGLQEIRWGETFGFQPVDLVNARNYRDFQLLDHGRNRIPAWIAKVTYQSGPVTLSALGNPKGEVPILPERLRGVPVFGPAQNTGWGVSPELGLKASLLLADANIDLFAYRHLNRIPRLQLSARGLEALFEPVLSLGAGFSKGFAEWVVRADVIYTPQHPTPDASFTRRETQDSYDATLGTDWSPTDGLTVGVQGHLDRYPTPKGTVSAGAAVMVRKALLHDHADLEATAFQSFTYQDRWLQVGAKFRFFDGLEARILLESMRADAASPLAFFAATGRASTLVTYTF